MSELFRAAENYLKDGLYIFPLTEKSKITVKKTHGLLGASNSTDIGIDPWETNPNYNIGLNCGMSGLAVIDIDMNHDNGYNGEDSWNKLLESKNETIETLEASTPKGGRHLFFFVPDGCSISSSVGKLNADGEVSGVAPGVDVRGDGGYIVVCPSITKDGNYKWLTSSGEFEPDKIQVMPNWLVERTQKREYVKPEPTQYEKKAGKLPLPEVKKALECIDPNCDHDTWRDIGMGLKAYDDSSEMFDLYYEWSSKYPNFKPNKLKGKWDSFKKDGISIGTVIHHAKKGGYKPIFTPPTCNIDPSKDPNYDPLIRGYFDSVKENHKYPDTKEEALCRYFPVDDKSSRVYDAAIDEEKDLTRVSVAIGNAIKDEVIKNDKVILKPWNFVTDYRCRLISSRNIKFDPVNKLKWPFINTYRGLGFDENDYNQYEVDKGRDEFYKILFYVCDGNKNHADMIMKWLAYPIQHNNRKCKWNVIAKSPKKGVGKSVLFDNIIRGMYNHLHRQSGEVNAGLIYGKKIREVDLLGRFNKWMHRALFAVVEEISSSHKEAVQISNMLKDIATSDHYLMEAKRQDPILIRIFFQMVFLSNHNLPIRLEQGDRRFFVVGTNNRRLDKEEYDYLYDVLQDKPWMMGHILRQEKDVPREFGLALPEITPLHKEMVGASMSPSERFVALFINGELGVNPVYPFKASDIFKLYEKWCEVEGEVKSLKKRFLIESLKEADFIPNNQLSAHGVKTRFFGVKHYGPREADLTNSFNQISDSVRTRFCSTELREVPSLKESMENIHELF